MFVFVCSVSMIIIESRDFENVDAFMYVAGRQAGNDDDDF